MLNEQMTTTISAPFLISGRLPSIPTCDCCSCAAPEDRIDDEWFENWCEKQPEMRKIGKKLLKIGGEGIVTPYYYGDPQNALEYLNLGHVAQGRRISTAGLSALAINEKVLCDLEDDPEIFEIDTRSICTATLLRCPMLGVGIGFALVGGFWTERIWLMDGSRILETDVPGEAYFGTMLYGTEAQVWAALWSGDDCGIDKVEKRLRKFSSRPAQHLRDTLYDLDEGGCIILDEVEDGE